MQQEQPQPQALAPSPVDSQATLPYCTSSDATPPVIDDSVDQGSSPVVSEEDMEHWSTGKDVSVEILI